MSVNRVEIRAFTMQDLPAVTSLWNATMNVDPINEQRLTREFILDPHFDPDAFLVAELDARLVGFVLGMTARADIPSDNAVGTGVIVGLGVAESHRRQGIGLQILRVLESYWSQSALNRIQVGPWIPSYLAPGVDELAYPGTVEFLTELGFDPGAKPVSMRALLTGYEASAEVPELVATLEQDGVTVRPAVAEDSLDLLAFAAGHFPHWESYVRNALRATAVTMDDATLHVALDGEAVIGFAMTDGERFGPFGVNSDYRGRGVGAVLLSRALRAMRGANIHMAYFLWTSDQTARLYNRHGFEIVRRFTMMSKELSAHD